MGILLKKFSLVANDFDKQVKHASDIQTVLGNRVDNKRLLEQISTYNRLKNERKQLIQESQNSWFSKINGVQGVSVDNDEVWGSKRQYLYGRACQKILRENGIDLEVFMCIALNPTGGICGAGNQSLYRGTVTSPIIIHSCIHDASGYCYSYHKLGKGYNYIGTYFALPTRFAMSCQLMGIYYCYRS